jgi:hypothetical protein
MTMAWAIFSELARIIYRRLISASCGNDGPNRVIFSNKIEPRKNPPTAKRGNRHCHFFA